MRTALVQTYHPYTQFTHVHPLAIMMIAGFYDESGLWAYTAGLPAKTGVGGGIVAVVPGTMAIVGFSPRVNEAGNSVRAMKAIEYISDQLGVNVFGSGR